MSTIIVPQGEKTAKGLFPEVMRQRNDLVRWLLF